MERLQNTCAEMVKSVESSQITYILHVGYSRTSILFSYFCNNTRAGEVNIHILDQTVAIQCFQVNLHNFSRLAL